MVIEVLYKSFRYEKFDSSAQTNSEPFRAKGTNILTDWNLYLGALEENGIILAEHWYDGNPQHAGGQDCISLMNGYALGSVSIGKTAATNCRNDLCDSLHCKLYISWNGCK